MAIIQKPKTERKEIQSQRDNRERLVPFLNQESGIKALQSFIGSDNLVTREGMYTLEILNNLIQSNYGQSNLYQRIPPEVFGGCSEGGRRNVQASLLARAENRSDEPQSREICESGYTRLQEIIGRWAERDGSWHDYPDSDLKKKGMTHVKERDGSEAHIFVDKSNRVYKTIDCSHYNDFQLMLDRINIFNATFPETALRVEGFGLRDDAIIPSNDFVVIVSQPFVEGEKPTMKQIEEGMAARGYDRTANGFFFVSRLDNTVISDVHDENAVVTSDGKLLVFDSEAFLKYFKTETIVPERVSIKDFMPSPSTGKLDSDAWKKLLGNEYNKYSEEQKSRIYRELRLTGSCKEPVNGHSVSLDKPKKFFREGPGGKAVIYYEGDVLYGDPNAFKDEHVYTVKDLQYSDESVRSIRGTIQQLMPYSMTLDEFLFSEKFVGNQTARYKGGGDYRRYYKEQLKTNGMIDELVNDKYLVQTDPNDNERVLIMPKENVEFMLWSNNTMIPDYGVLSNKDKEELASGKTLTKGSKTFFFSLDKGRVDECIISQKKLKVKQEQEIEVKREKKQERKQKLTL